MMIMPYSTRLFTPDGVKTSSEIVIGDIVYGMNRSGSLLLYKVLSKSRRLKNIIGVNIITKHTILKALRWNYVLTDDNIIKKVDNLRINEYLVAVNGLPIYTSKFHAIDMNKNDRKMVGLLTIDNKKNLDFSIKNLYNIDVSKITLTKLQVVDIKIKILPVIDILFNKTGFIISDFHVLV